MISIQVTEKDLFFMASCVDEDYSPFWSTSVLPLSLCETGLYTEFHLKYNLLLIIKFIINIIL